MPSRESRTSTFSIMHPLHLADHTGMDPPKHGRAKTQFHRKHSTNDTSMSCHNRSVSEMNILLSAYHMPTKQSFGLGLQTLCIFIEYLPRIPLTWNLRTCMSTGYILHPTLNLTRLCNIRKRVSKFTLCCFCTNWILHLYFTTVLYGCTLFGC